MEVEKNEQASIRGFSGEIPTCYKDKRSHIPISQNSDNVLFNKHSFELQTLSWAKDALLLRLNLGLYINGINCGNIANMQPKYGEVALLLSKILTNFRTLILHNSSFNWTTQFLKYIFICPFRSSVKTYVNIFFDLCIRKLNSKV